MNTYYKFTYVNPWMFNTWVNTRILKKIKIYTRIVKKFNEKQSFHHQLTKVNCIPVWCAYGEIFSNLVK